MAEDNNSILGSNTVLTSRAADPERAYRNAKEACEEAIEIARNAMAYEPDDERKENLRAHINTLVSAGEKMDALKAKGINDAFVYRGFAQLNWNDYEERLYQLNRSLNRNPVLPPVGSEERMNEIQSRMVPFEDRVQKYETLDITNRSPEVMATMAEDLIEDMARVAPAATPTNWDMAYAATLREREAALAVPETAETYAQALETVRYTDGVLSDLAYLRDQGFSSFVGFVTNEDGTPDVPTFTSGRKRLVNMAASPSMDSMRNKPAVADPYIASQIGVPLPGTAAAQEIGPAEPPIEMAKPEVTQKYTLAQFGTDFFAAFILRKQERVAAKAAKVAAKEIEKEDKKQAAFFEGLDQRQEARQAARAAKADAEPIELTDLIEDETDAKPTENLAATPQEAPEVKEEAKKEAEAKDVVVPPVIRSRPGRAGKKKNGKNKKAGVAKPVVTAAAMAAPMNEMQVPEATTAKPVTMAKKPPLSERFTAAAKKFGRKVWENRAEIGVGLVSGFGLRLGSRYLMGVTGATALPWILVSTATIGTIVGGLRGYMRLRKMRKDGTIEKRDDGHEYILGKVKNEQGDLVDGMVRFNAKMFVTKRALLGGAVSLAVGSLGIAAADALSHTEFGGWLRETVSHIFGKGDAGLNSITDKPPVAPSDQMNSIYSARSEMDVPAQKLAMLDPASGSENSIYSMSHITDKPSGASVGDTKSIYGSDKGLDVPAQKLAMDDPMGGDKSIHDGTSHITDKPAGAAGGAKAIHNGLNSIHDGKGGVGGARGGAGQPPAHDTATQKGASGHKPGAADAASAAPQSLSAVTGLSDAQINDLRAHGIEIPKNTKSPAVLARFYKDASDYYQYRAPVRDVALGTSLIDKGVALVEEYGLANGPSGTNARMLFADQAFDRMYRTHDYQGAAESAKKAGNIRGGWAKKLLNRIQLKGLDSAAKADALAKQIVSASQADAVAPQGVAPVAPVQPAAPAAAAPMGAAAADSASLESQGLPLIRPPAASPLGAAVSHGAATVEAHKLPLITPPAVAQANVPPVVPDVMPQSVASPIEPRVQMGTPAAQTIPPVQGEAPLLTNPELPPVGPPPAQTPEPQLLPATHKDSMARLTRRIFRPRHGMA